MASNHIIAILGPTGGCALSCLRTLLLERRTIIRCLARSPDKLRSLLAEHGLEESRSTSLTIVQGDAKDALAVKETVAGSDVIVFGIGGSPHFTWSLSVQLDDPFICESAMRTLIEAVGDIPEARRPKRLVLVSTTGIDEKGWDVPMLLIPFYWWSLHQPHQDKRKMEAVLEQRQDGLLPEVIVVRPSLLTDGAGWLAANGAQVRMGEGEVGYTVSRNDVGKKLAMLCGNAGDLYVGKAVRVTN